MFARCISTPSVLAHDEPPPAAAPAATASSSSPRLPELPPLRTNGASGAGGSGGGGCNGGGPAQFAARLRRRLLASSSLVSRDAALLVNMSMSPRFSSALQSHGSVDRGAAAAVGGSFQRLASAPSATAAAAAAAAVAAASASALSPRAAAADAAAVAGVPRSKSQPAMHTGEGRGGGAEALVTDGQAVAIDRAPAPVLLPARAASMPAEEGATAAAALEAEQQQPEQGQQHQQPDDNGGSGLKRLASASSATAASSATVLVTATGSDASEASAGSDAGANAVTSSCPDESGPAASSGDPCDTATDADSSSDSSDSSGSDSDSDGGVDESLRARLPSGPLRVTPDRRQLEESLEAAVKRSQSQQEPDRLSGAERLRRRLAALGLAPVASAADGNCLFRSVSQQLFGTQAHHAALRAEAVRHMRCGVFLFAAALPLRRREVELALPIDTQSHTQHARNPTPSHPHTLAHAHAHTHTQNSTHSGFYAAYLGEEFGAYIASMRRSGTWGDELTLVRARLLQSRLFFSFECTVVRLARRVPTPPPPSLCSVHTSDGT